MQEIEELHFNVSETNAVVRSLKQECTKQVRRINKIKMKLKLEYSKNICFSSIIVNDFHILVAEDDLIVSAPAISMWFY
jgi:hypothetical protein